ncbi:hypothetical protein CEUSTIGMA_g828.t1, partial [Chlamydomonas eustigma]
MEHITLSTRAALCSYHFPVYLIWIFLACYPICAHTLTLLERLAENKLNHAQNLGRGHRLLGGTSNHQVNVHDAESSSLVGLRKWQSDFGGSYQHQFSVQSQAAYSQFSATAAYPSELHKRRRELRANTKILDSFSANFLAPQPSLWVSYSGIVTSHCVSLGTCLYASPQNSQFDYIFSETLSSSSPPPPPPPPPPPTSPTNDIASLQILPSPPTTQPPSPTANNLQAPPPLLIPPLQAAPSHTSLPQTLPPPSILHSTFSIPLAGSPFPLPPPPPSPKISISPHNPYRTALPPPPPPGTRRMLVTAGIDVIIAGMSDDLMADASSAVNSLQLRSLLGAHHHAHPPHTKPSPPLIHPLLNLPSHSSYISFSSFVLSTFAHPSSSALSSSTSPTDKSPNVIISIASSSIPPLPT